MTATPKPASLPNAQKVEDWTETESSICLINATLYTPQSQPSHNVSHLLVNGTVWGVMFVVEI